MATPMSAGQIVVHLEGNVVGTFELNAPVLTIGRLPANNIALPHPMVSREHAELRFSPEGPAITDLGSTHGTFIGSERLREQLPRVLRNGDVVTIGPFRLTFRAAAAPEPAAGDDELDVSDVLDAVELQPVVVAPPDPPRPPQPPRPRWPPQPGPLVPSSYLRDLPIIYQESDFLGRFLRIFESIWEPLEQRQSHIQMYFDPRTSPAEMLPWLASWLDLAYNRHWPEERLRRLVAEAMDLYRWRGTRYGLARMIEIHTGLTPEIRDDPSQPFVFHVRLATAGNGAIDRALVEDVIQLHKPAHTGYVLEVVS